MVIIMTMMMMMVIIMINDDDYNWIWFSRVETICSSWERTRSKAIFSLTKDWLRAHLQIVITWPCLHPYKMAFLAPIGPEALIAPFLDFQSVNWCNRHYKSHSKSFKQYQCNWCHKSQKSNEKFQMLIKLNLLLERTSGVSPSFFPLLLYFLCISLIS